MRPSAVGVSAFVIALGAVLAALSAFDQAQADLRAHKGASLHRSADGKRTVRHDAKLDVGSHGDVNHDAGV